MSWTNASGVRSAMTKGALAGALIVVAATGAAGPATAMPALGGTSIAPAPLQPPGPPTGPDDPRCITQPTNPVCRWRPVCASASAGASASAAAAAAPSRPG